MCPDSCEPICFKLSTMLDMTRVKSILGVWMTVTFTQSHRVTGKLELVQLFCCKVSRSSPYVCDGSSCMGDHFTEDLQVWRECIVWVLAVLVISISWTRINVHRVFVAQYQCARMWDLELRVYAICFVWKLSLCWHRAAQSGFWIGN